MQWIIIFVVFSFFKPLHATQQCSQGTYSVSNHYLRNHVISTKITSGLSECIFYCSDKFHCKSFNFRLADKSCELNDADRFTHAQDYGPRYGYVYMDTSEPHKAEEGFKSCAEIHQKFPREKNGYYWITIGDRDAQVYCDMENHGGGWTLVSSISSKSNDHLQRNANNCSNSIVCVPYMEGEYVARKLDDQDIHKLAAFEGTFRVDVEGNSFSVFYQIPSGHQHFNSTCRYGSCPRIIISYHYPYQWETNTCTTISVGYKISHGCHSAFDGHDDQECGSPWMSSLYVSNRALYGYPCPQDPIQSSLGMYKNRQGLLYVK